MLTTWRHSVIGLATAASMAPMAQAQMCVDVDLNSSGNLDIWDVLILFDQHWGQVGGMADFNADGLVDGLDLAYLLAHVDIDEDGCLPLPAPAPDGEVEFIVRDATTMDDADQGLRRYGLFAKFENPASVVLSVANANVGCTEPPCFISDFLDGSFVSIGSDADAMLDPNFSMPEFEAGLGVGDDAGWWTLGQPGNHPGRAGDYQCFEVQLAQFITPEASDLAGELSFIWRSAEHELFVNTVEFEVQPVGDCYADFNDDGVLNILDFIAFQDAFSAGDVEADCDGCGSFDILDFICFHDHFQNGCP